MFGFEQEFDEDDLCSLLQQSLDNLKPAKESSKEECMTKIHLRWRRKWRKRSRKRKRSRRRRKVIKKEAMINFIDQMATSSLSMKVAASSVWLLFINFISFRSPRVDHVGFTWPTRMMRLILILLP